LASDFVPDTEGRSHLRPEFAQLELEIPDLTRSVDLLAVERWMARNGVTLAELQDPDRHTSRVTARRHVVHFLRGREWSYEEIGRYLNRHWTSVRHLAKTRQGRR
jgi:hypothetical protein